MAILSPEETQRKRNELLDQGFTIVPGMMPESLLNELSDWSAERLPKIKIDDRIRYQGSDIFVFTECHWEKTNGKPMKGDHPHFKDPIAEKVIELPAQLEVCRQLGLENLKSDGSLIILSKPGHGPPLYWHQDFMNWNSPQAATPWPTKIFLSYYLTDTTRKNGCLRVIPGSHRKRHLLHDLLPDAHDAELQAIDDLSHPAFANYPDAIDVPLKAGDLIIADARLMHSAWPNQTAERRTLMLAWHDVFQFPEPPSWWIGDIPDIIKNADPNAHYERSRTPNHYIA